MNKPCRCIDLSPSKKLFQCDNCGAYYIWADGKWEEVALISQNSDKEKNNG